MGWLRNSWWRSRSKPCCNRTWSRCSIFRNEEEKEKMNKQFVMMMFVLVLLVPLVNAVPPVTETFVGDSSLVIQANSFTHYTSNPRWNNLHIYNSSNGVLLSQSNANITCDVEVVNSQGFLIAEINATPVDDHYSLNGSGSLDIGTYGYVINCEEHDIGLGGYLQGEIEITESGKDQSDLLPSIVIIFGAGLIALVLIFLIGHIDKEHFMLKLFALFFVSFLFLVMAKVGVDISVGMLYEATALTLYNIATWWVRIFALYVFMYFNYVAWFKFVIGNVFKQMGHR